MDELRRMYITPSFRARGTVEVADIGSRGAGRTYRDLFSSDRGFRYTGVDLVPGPNVDLVLTNPYEIPMSDGSVDLVISGQMFEHCEFFWLSFLEMLRILKHDGYIFLIAPSVGPVHRAPVDCWRFYPDSYRALAKWGRCKCVESWRDTSTTLQHGQRHIWHDMVGVFRHCASARAAWNVSHLHHRNYPGASSIAKKGEPAA
jgi:SAM-dependent methyltransferase